MSHDIRTPMNGILGMTQIAMNHLNDPARILDCLQKIDDSSRHLLELINEVLDMSKIESGDTTLHEEPLYLSKTMKIVDGVCRQAAVDKHQIFRYGYRRNPGRSCAGRSGKTQAGFDQSDFKWSEVYA